MLVRDLVQVLQSLPQDLPVVLDGPDEATHVARAELGHTAEDSSGCYVIAESDLPIFPQAIPVVVLA